MNFTIRASVLSVLLASALQSGVHCFSTSLQSSQSPALTHSNAFHVLKSSSVENDTKEKATPTKEEITNDLYFPLTFDEMVKQTSSTMEAAYAKGITRQVVRILLPRTADNDNLLKYYEGEASDEIGETVLVPPDETWQGGIMQLYRACSFACENILRRYSRNAGGGVVPRLQEDRSVDESGVDGIGVWITQGSQPEDDVSCFVQPSQETVDAIDSISQQAGKRLVTLMNPQWRITDDALDTASRTEGLLGNFASFLGGKGGSLRRLDDMCFESTFILEGYVVRGGNARIMKRFDSDWAVFAENDAATEYIKVGTSENRPTYQDIDAMLEDKGIALKYARDIGLAPKL